MSDIKNKMGIVVAVLFSLLVTATAVSAYSVNNDHTVIKAVKVVPPIAKLAVDPVDGDFGFRISAPLNSKIILLDLSKGGKAQWKKWYANDKIISYTLDDTYTYTCTKPGNVVFYLKAANSANSAKASISEKVTVYVYRRP